MKYKSEVEGRGEIRCRVVADSVSHNDVRLITAELRYPRFIHSELMTHRVFSRNASSSRAIPVEKMLDVVEKDPATPVHWGRNQKGMQAHEELTDHEQRIARLQWRGASREAAAQARLLHNLGLHKQIVNRITEPFHFINVLVTATEWNNWHKLRAHPDAQPEIHELALTMEEAFFRSSPEYRDQGDWHLPYVSSIEKMKLGIDTALKCSTARCARVSYTTFDMKEPTVENDLRLYEQLIVSEPQHASPAEHQAKPLSLEDDVNELFPYTWEPGITHIDRNKQHWSGNFRGWVQHRQLL